MNKEIIIDGVDVSDWADEEVRYKFEKHSSKAIRQIAFDLYKQLKQKEQECEEINLKNERLVVEKYTMNEEILKLKQALDEIERFCKDVCDSCKEFTPNRQSDISCRFCQATRILNIINKVKEEINEES